MNPKVKEILKVLAVTGFIAASFVMPGLPSAITPFQKKLHKKWGHFNRRRLKAVLKRLEQKGIIQQSEHQGEPIFEITEKGKVKLFKYQLEDISLTRKSWDRKWRLVAYDIPKNKRNQADAFRLLLKKMQFLQLQKSLWLTPFPCSKEIEFLKGLYSLKDNVSILTIAQLEGEMEYRKYFGI